MPSSYFYLQAEKNFHNTQFIDAVEAYSELNKIQLYVINKPLGDPKYTYSYHEHLILLRPGVKILLLNFGEPCEAYNDFYEDFLEDLSAIADKYRYKDVIGRSRKWRSELVDSIQVGEHCLDIDELLKQNLLDDSKLRRNSELLISLLTGSINDVDNVKGEVPDNILDKVKRKIILFDGDQTRFIYSKPNKKRISIQGLSGTGKTELLLHKLRDLYTDKSSSRVMFTCHNKILADRLRSRIPEFFDFMKVEEQIQWNKRLWCVHAWGSDGQPNTGAYSYICSQYGIQFLRFTRNCSFDDVCKLAIEHIQALEQPKYVFDYMLIDESQDFPDSFFQLCELVSEKEVYVAGDIFQRIFNGPVISDINPDYLLSKCYRTDPRTLMFAHAVGMGLFELPKLRWLEDAEWKACGYVVEHNNIDSAITLRREPLRRFEELTIEGIASVSIQRTVSNPPEHVVDAILSIINEIKRENPTVLPSDIGIIFIDYDQTAYKTADYLERRIPIHFGWEVNKAYETKQSIQDAVFISNRNNVKGLEFPFVICVARKLSRVHGYRNSLYMMLTRSFLKSYLLVSSNLNSSDFLDCLEEGLSVITSERLLKVSIPSDDEKQALLMHINYDAENISFHDFIHKEFDRLLVPHLKRDKLYEIVRGITNEDLEYEDLSSTIEQLYRMMSRTNEEI